MYREGWEWLWLAVPATPFGLAMPSASDLTG